MVGKQRISKKLWGVIVVITLLIASILFLESNRTVKDNILNENFITVQPWYISGKISFDLEKKSYFSIRLAEAVKDGKVYEGYEHVRNNGNTEFEKAKAYTLYYPLIASNVTKKRVRHENFKVKQKVPKKYGEVIKHSIKRLSTSEMIITYNKNYLPVKVQLYDKVGKKWMVFAKYSYPI